MANFIPEQKTYKRLTPFKLAVLQNFPYIEEDFDALTNYGLLCKVVEYLNKVIENENNLEDNVTGLHDAFVSLHNYVNNYFNTLDLHAEVNAKLDEMAQSGELTDIIAQYLRLAGVLVYSSISEMKQAQNLANGSHVMTYGYRTNGDGGGARYIVRPITNQDVLDDSLVIALANVSLVAELCEDKVISIKQVGAYGNGTNDDSLYLSKALGYANDKGLKVFIPKGEYIINTPVSVNYNNVTIIGESGSYLNGDGCSNDTLTFTGSNGVIIDSLELSSRNASSILMYDCSNVKINGCNITLKYKENTNASCISIHRVSGSALGDCVNYEISNCNIVSSFLGVLFQGRSGKYLKNAFIHNCVFTATQSNIPPNGELLKVDYYTDNTIINNNEFHDVRNSAITCEENSNNIVIDGNIIEGGADTVIGIRTYKGQQNLTSEYLTISNNIIKNCPTGILNESYNHVNISGNTVVGSTTNSLSLWDATDRIVSGNYIKGRTIIIRDGTKFMNNTCIASVNGIAMLQLTNSEHAVISGNVLDSGNIIVVTSQDLTIKDNIMKNQISPSTGAITFYNNNSTVYSNFIIKDNTVIGVAGSLKYGIYFQDSHSNVLVDNNFFSNYTTDIIKLGNTTNLENRNGRRYVSFGTSAPTSGSHAKGDVVYNSNPTNGGYIGWVCTSAGTPGTWRGFGTIA